MLHWSVSAMSLTFVDVNGLGGFMSLGFVREGFEMVGRTGTLDFGNKAAEANRHLLGDGWQSLFSNKPDEWPLHGKVDVVAGCPPCSGWSCWSGSQNRGPEARAHDHPWAFIHYAARVKPAAVVFESVQQAYTQGADMMRGYRDALEQESGVSYDLHHVKMNNLMIGGSSYRPRYFWVAVKKGMPFGVEAQWPGDGAKLPTIMDMIGDLAETPQTWGMQVYQHSLGDKAERLRAASGMFDGHIGRESIHSQRIAEVFEQLPGGNSGWDWGMDLGTALKRCYDAHGTLPPSWKSKEEKIVANDFYLGFTQPYRWRGDTWANVLTGGALDLVIHPTEPRGITHREAARIQGLPDDWLIEPTRYYSPLQSVWGKAVSVDAGTWIARWVRNSLQGAPGAFEPEQLGPREWLHNTDYKFSRDAARKRYYPNAGSGVTRIWMKDKTAAAA